MSVSRYMLSGQAQVYLAEWRVIWGAGRQRYWQPPLEMPFFSHQFVPGRETSLFLSEKISQAKWVIFIKKKSYRFLGSDPNN